MEPNPSATPEGTGAVLWKLGGRKGRLENPYTEGTEALGKGLAQGHTLNSTGSRVSPSYSWGNENRRERTEGSTAPGSGAWGPAVEGCTACATGHFLLPLGDILAATAPAEW